MLLKEHLSIRQLFSNKMFPILHQTLPPLSSAVIRDDDQQRPSRPPLQRAAVKTVFRTIKSIFY